MPWLSPLHDKTYLGLPKLCKRGNILFSSFYRGANQNRQGKKLDQRQTINK